MTEPIEPIEPIEPNGDTTESDATIDTTIGTIPSHVPEAETASENTTDLNIPDEYKEAAYLKDVTSMDDVFKKLDGAQKLIGQRQQGVPGEDATPEQWDEFYKSAGRPEDPKDYEFKYEEGQEASLEAQEGLKKICHEAGLSNKQVGILQPAFDKFAQDLAEQQQTASVEAADAEFNKLSTEMFGDKADEVLADVKKILNDNKPANMADFDEHLNQLSNKDLLIMSGVLNNVKQRYMSEDAIVNSGVPTGTSSQELQEEGRKLLASEAYANSFHPKHAETKARISEIYEMRAKMTANRK